MHRNLTSINVTVMDVYHSHWLQERVYTIGILAFSEIQVFHQCAQSLEEF